ncbi:M10 family metallopeptidase C-terminal domain-containing protein [Mameliella alba]|nr:M10 family metallopeptidase C-terminal domain-containing protein [Antarctobacter heliothermus]MBY6143989.1 M10 family metallopeptidase C-terminal domain-containing protein [Mameliella alba]
MCFLCQSLDPRSDYDFHGLTGPTSARPQDSESDDPANAKPVYTLDQVAYQLTHAYWQDGGGDWRAFDVQYGDEISVNITALDAMGQQAALDALDAWSAVSGLVFTVTIEDADITFQHTDTGAYAYSAVYTSWNEIAYSVVNVHVSWQSNADYYYQTYIHEIGHALGLGHGGNYNGSGDFASDAHYANDSWQMSVMSYFAQWENPNVDASYAYLATPQMADILAIHTLYGTPDNVHTGNTVYGDGTPLTSAGMDLAPGYAVTIFDSDGIDTIDLGSRTADQRLSLLAETWSDLDGYVGTFGIARGAVIENAVTGSGDDTVTGNSAANDISTGAGADILIGGAGSDTLTAGDGSDLLVGGAGADIMDGGDGLDTVSYAGSDSGIRVALYNNTASGGDAEGDSFASIENLTGSDHDDVLSGDANDNVFIGGAGADQIYGGYSRDTASYETSDAGVTVALFSNSAAGGHAEGDSLVSIGNLIGSDYDDVLSGNGGRNALSGGDGDDQIYGGGRADTIDGGAGNDILVGGSGPDQFIFGDSSGQDRVLDFEDGSDVIQLTGGLSFDDLTVTAETDGLRVALTADPTVFITLEGLAPGDITAADFI